MIDLKKVARERYSAKAFNPSKIITEELFEQILDLLRFSPSSTNIQPWHFIIGNTQEGKERIAKGTQGFFIFNERKVLDASHVIIICSKTGVDDNYMLKLLKQEDEDGRFATPELKLQMQKGRKMFSDIHEKDLKDHQHWLEKQVYLNYGNIAIRCGSIRDRRVSDGGNRY